MPIPVGCGELAGLDPSVGASQAPRMVRMTSLLVCAFFDIYLRKKLSALLKDVSSQFPEIAIETSSVKEVVKHAQ